MESTTKSRLSLLFSWEKHRMEPVRINTRVRGIDISAMSCVIWASMTFRKSAMPTTMLLATSVKP